MNTAVALRSVVLTLCLVAAALVSASAGGADFTGTATLDTNSKPFVLFTTVVSTNATNSHFPSGCVYGDRIIVSWSASDTHFQTNGVIWFADSYDSGKTWCNYRTPLPARKHGMAAHGLSALSDGSLIECWIPRDYTNGTSRAATHYPAVVLQSRDGGNSWFTNSLIGTGQCAGALTAVLETPAKTWLIPLHSAITGTNSTVARSTNGGGSWDFIPVSANCNEIRLDTDPSGKIYCVGRPWGAGPPEINASTNDGLSWERIGNLNFTGQPWQSGLPEFKFMGPRLFFASRENPFGYAAFWYSDTPPYTTNFTHLARGRHPSLYDSVFNLSPSCIGVLSSFSTYSGLTSTNTYLEFWVLANDAQGWSQEGVPLTNRPAVWLNRDDINRSSRQTLWPNRGTLGLNPTNSATEGAVPVVFDGTERALFCQGRTNVHFGESNILLSLWQDNKLTVVFRAARTNNTGDQRVLNNANSERQVGCDLYLDGGALRFKQYNGSGTPASSYRIPVGLFTNGDFHVYAIRLNGNETADSFTDGSLVYQVAVITNSTGSKSYSTDTKSTCHLSIGTYGFSTTGGPLFLGDLLLWTNAALSDNEIYAWSAAVQRASSTVRPTLAIAAPAWGQCVSNAVFTVTGTASDNVGVSNVRYQLNGGDWDTAMGTNSWTATVDLAPGTNVVRAFALDTSGNTSTTNSVSFVCVLSATVTVQINGNGTVSPNYDGQSLEIGKTYSMTAQAGTGFAFTNWTGSLTTNALTLTFTMQSNLTFTANFVDVTRPTLAIAAPASDQRWSNAVFTVTGTASDNLAVSNVWCQLNGGDWDTATGTTNWTATVDLAPGTNVVRAFARDTSGNTSTTNSVSFICVLSATLAVHTNGVGTVTPNYGGQSLEIGQTYSMTARAGTGFAFTNWTGSLTTNALTLTFTMQSNLTFTANFVDVTRPTLAIAAPASGQRVSNAVFTVSGAASDNAGISNVWYQLNGGDWDAATGTNSWTATVDLVPGTNVVRAFALDTSGNISTTNSVSFIGVLIGTLVVQINGPGTVAPDYSGKLLEIGKGYTMTAKPGAGCVFSNWVNGAGAALTNGTALKFTMQGHLVLQANFITNPFVSGKGTYHGLFYNTNQANGLLHESSGFFTLSLTGKGAYSASLQLGGKRCAWSGLLDVSGTVNKTILRSRTNWLTVDWTVDLTPGADCLAGTISDGFWSADLSADRAVFNTRTFPATNYAGKYTMVIQRTNDDASLPAGDGYGTVNVNTAGKIKLSGSLADGTALSQSTTVSKDGQWPFYASLYGGKGSALSWITFTNLDGRFSWIKPALPTARFYRAGFTNAEFVAKGSRYTQPGRTNRVMELTDGTNGIVTFTGGELPDFTNHVTLGTANRVVNTSSNRLTLTIARSSGAFNGTVAPPGATRRIPFKGVLLQNHNHGSGYFLGTNQTGRVYFGPE